MDAFSKCHPVVNFIFFVGAIGFGVIIQHPAYIVVGFLAALVYYLLLKGIAGLKALLFVIPMFLFISLINPLFNHYGSHILFTVFGNPYTLEALYYGFAVGGIFQVMMVWFLCYNQVLTSDKFVCLFGSLIPALSMVLVMVLRMIPNLMGKAVQLSAARKSIGRGAGEQSTNREKLQDGMLILSALTDWALEGSIVTADSMRSRGYGSAKRTSFTLYRMQLRDWLLLLFLAILGLIIILAGGFDAAYTPEIQIAAPGFGLVAYGAFLLIPTLLHMKEALQWHISISRI